MMGVGLAQCATSQCPNYELLCVGLSNQRFYLPEQLQPLVIDRYCRGTPL